MAGVENVCVLYIDVKHFNKKVCNLSIYRFKKKTLQPKQLLKVNIVNNMIYKYARSTGGEDQKESESGLQHEPKLI